MSNTKVCIIGAGPDGRHTLRRLGQACVRLRLPRMANLPQGRLRPEGMDTAWSSPRRAGAPAGCLPRWGATLQPCGGV